MFCEACIKHNISFTVKSLLFESSDIVCVCVCQPSPNALANQPTRLCLLDLVDSIFNFFLKPVAPRAEYEKARATLKTKKQPRHQLEVGGNRREHVPMRE